MKYFIYTLILVFFSACSIFGIRYNDNFKDKIEESLPNESYTNSYDILDSVCQQRRFSQNDTLRWTGNEGTQIIIYPNSFDSNDDTLTLFLKECYKLSDLLKYNLQTLTDTRGILQTKGMIYLNVIDSKGNKVMLSEGASIFAIFADTNVSSEYMLYNGIEKNNSIVWTNPTKRIDKFRSIFFSIPKEGDEGYELYQNNELLYIEYLTMKRYGSSNLELATFELQSLGWKNLDKPYKTNNFVTFSIEIEQQFENGRLYSIYPTEKILVEFNKVNNKFISDRIIANKKHILLFIGEINGDTFYRMVKESYSSQNKSLKFNKLLKCEDIKAIIESQISWV